LYAADVGGNVWRVDIDDASTSNWKVWKIAAVGKREATPTPSARKFLFGPDVVLGVGANAFDAVVIGSGDREHPLASNGASGVADRVYMFADTATGMTGKDLGITDTCGAAVGDCSNLFDATNERSVKADAKGWSISLAAGEKVINSPLVVASSMIFGTNKPNPKSCEGNLGIAQRYAVDVLTGAGTLGGSGTGVRSEVAGVGFLASPIVVGNLNESAGITRSHVADNPLKGGGIKPFVIETPTKRFRTHWRDLLE
jgi:type IV pilus assembly protein PilY1